MDIMSKGKYPSNALSNFHPRKFIFDDIECNSIEGVLASFKFDKPHIQAEVCKLVGLAAKSRGRSRNKAWTTKQCLWWKYSMYERDSDEYTELLTRLYDSVFEQSESYRNALMATKGMVLQHSIGKNKKSETVLTATEFISQLNRLRNKLFKN